MSLTREDFPEPLTPVTAVKTCNGNFTSIPFKLLCEAPRTVMYEFHVPGLSGTGITLGSLKKRRVRLSGTSTFSPGFTGGPWYISRPPSFPAKGPMSMIWSAARIISSSCSTTITVFPMSLRAFKDARSLWVSRGCSPILGSSRI